MNTTDWFVFIQQEHYFAPKCFAGLLWLLRPQWTGKSHKDRSIMAFFKKNEDYLNISEIS
jgi:hypothetical protein